MSEFPTAEVERITRTKCPKKGDSHVYWKKGTLADLRSLIALKVAGEEADEYIGESGLSVAELIEKLTPYESDVTVFGYIIYPPRDDARVSLEGFEITENATVILQLLNWHLPEGFSSKHRDEGIYVATFRIG